MSASVGVTLTSRCSFAAADKVLALPIGTTSQASHLLVEGNGTSRIMKSGLRSDAGAAACASASVVHALGGEGVQVTYRPIGLAGRLRRDQMLLVQAVIALLTWAGAALGAYGTWLKNSADTDSAWNSQTATIIFIIAALAASFKFYKEAKEL